MKIVVLDGFTLNPGDLAWDALQSLGEVVIYDRTGVEEIVERSADAQVVLSNKVPLSAETLNRLPKLKYIGVLATGYNIINTAAAKDKGIIVSNVPGYGTDSVVQLTFALLLELCLRVQRHSDAVISGRWSQSADFSFWDFPLMELAGKTMGVIGFGSIGAKAGAVASAFGMNVIGSSRSRRNPLPQPNFRWAEIPELLRESDVVSIHCPLLPETKGLINRDRLAMMKSSAFLLNTSRGPIVVEEDLASALHNGVIAGAGIDVLSIEPPPANNPLLSAPNCIITPHIAWATREARSRLMDAVVDNLKQFTRGEPVNVVNQ